MGEAKKKICLSIYRYTHTQTHHTMEYYSTIKKNEIVPFAATWTGPDIIIPREVSQIKTNLMMSFICRI